MSEYNFLRFTNRGAKLTNYKISINKTGSLGLLGGFYQKEKISTFKKAVLFYDRAKKAIAISFTNDDTEGAFAVSHNGERKNSGSVAAHSFFASHELNDPRYFGRKEPKKVKDDKLGTLFVIHLIENK